MQTHPPTQPVPSIDPAGVYTDADLRLMFELTSTSLARARREGRLRFTRQGKRVLHRGQWIIDWLEADAGETGKGAGHAK